jgi:hypothetical protein
MRAWASVAALLIFYACLHAFVLPPDGFVSGDQGTKLLQTRATLAHGPFHPWVEGMSHDLDTEFRYQEPLLLRRDATHLIGIFPWIFPAITAPFYWLFGLFGLYVVPALSVAVIFVAAHHLGSKLRTPGAGLSSAWCAVAATPVLFYGAEFWEHAPAVALTTIAAALLAPDGSLRVQDQSPRSSDEAPPPIVRAALAGASVAVATALRPEAAVMLPAMAAALVVVLGVRRAWRPILALASAFAIVTVATIPANIVVYGTAIPPQVSSNVAFGWARYGTMRADIIRALLLPAAAAPLFIAAIVAGAALAVRRSASPMRIAGCHAIVLVLAFCAVVVPLWRAFVGGIPPADAFTVTSLAHTWPFAFALVYACALPNAAIVEPTRRYLLLTTMIFVAGAVAVMPHSGGTQWGPRFLLPAAPLAAVLVSAVLRRSDRLGRGAASIRPAAAAVLLFSVLVQGLGLWKVLAHGKVVHAGIVSTTEALTKPGDLIVSDLFWFPELASRLDESRRLLFAWSPDDMNAIATRAAQHGLARLRLVSSLAETHYQPPPAFVLPNGGAFVQTQRHDFGVRGLTLYLYERSAR